MALVRCTDHYPNPSNTDRDYVAVVEPVGYPDTAVICGAKGRYHDESGYVLLDDPEYDEYLQGERIFKAISDGTQIRVTDTVYEEL